MSDSDTFEGSVTQVVFGYNPTKPPAIIAGGIFLALSVVLFFRLVRRREWWGLCLPIGTLCYSAGFFLRIAVNNNPNSTGSFVGMDILLVTSPAAFLAFNYIIYGRLLRNRYGDKYSYIRPQIIARVFIFSDVSTFSIQGAGGGIRTAVGTHITLVGLILQILSYALFILFLLDTHRRIKKDRTLVESQKSTFLFYALYFSSAFIMVRGLYRVAEFAQGFEGFLISHEVYFYFLDALPLFLATVIYAPFWPGRYVSVVHSEEYLGLQRLSPA